MADIYDMDGGDQSDKEQLMQLVGFMIGNELFGVNILMVQEIIRGAAITHVPKSPAFVEGVINLRGSIIPVIDLRKRLDLYLEPKKEGKNWILLLDIGGRITGFVVDRVTEVLKIQEDRLEAAPEIVTAGLESQYIQGVCEIGEKLLILLDFNRILLLEELRKLKKLDSQPQATTTA